MASTAGVIGGLGPHNYAAAKHAVVGLTKNAGAELCRFGIRVNGHCLTTDAGVTTGSKANSAPYSEPMPLMREAGKVEL